MLPKSIVHARLKSLEDHFQTAIVAGAEVKQLLKESPDLKKIINETHDDVKKLQTSIDLLKPLETHDAIIALKPVPQQVQKIETNQGKMQIQLDNIQKQVHEKK